MQHHPDNVHYQYDQSYHPSGHPVSPGNPHPGDIHFQNGKISPPADVLYQPTYHQQIYHEVAPLPITESHHGSPQHQFQYENYQHQQVTLPHESHQDHHEEISEHDLEELEEYFRKYHSNPLDHPPLGPPVAAGYTISYYNIPPGTKQQRVKEIYVIRTTTDSPTTIRRRLQQKIDASTRMGGQHGQQFPGSYQHNFPHSGYQRSLSESHTLPKPNVGHQSAQLQSYHEASTLPKNATYQRHDPQDFHQSSSQQSYHQVITSGAPINPQQGQQQHMTYVH